MVTGRVSKATLALGVASLLVVTLGAVTFVLLTRPTSTTMPGTGEAGPGNEQMRYRAEQPVDVWHRGSWYPGKINAVSGDRYFITYEGYSISWHEWVDATRLRERR